jgi:murein DD-endopeptidase MepM/ murein hydrolase activator NlpD
MKADRHIFGNSEFFVNFWLIVSKNQDPRSNSGLKITPKTSVGSGKIGVNILTRVFVFVLFASLLIPLRTEAGVFSFVTDLFSTSKADADETFPNSQNMALLQASLSPNTGAPPSSGDLSILSGTAILPETQEPFSNGNNYANQNDQISLYVVHKGDTLPAIAQMFGVTTNTIVWANDLKDGKISVGEQLVILPISGIQYIVKSGDTLSGIVKKTNGNLDDILSYNNLQSDSKLSVGDTIFIPDGEMSADSESGGGSDNSAVSPSGSNQNTSVIYSDSYNSFMPDTGYSKILSGPDSIPVGARCENYPALDGYYLRPVTTCIKTQGIHGHNAVDLAAENHQIGQAIMAAADGEVIVSRDSGWNGGYGSYIVIKHDNGTETLYAHLSATDVQVGDEVTQGEVIGAMGSTGDSTGPHLHFEIRGARNPF